MSNANNATDKSTTVLDMERILVMAEQIGFFFAPYPPLRAAEGVRNHLRTYWIRACVRLCWNTSISA